MLNPWEGLSLNKYHAFNELEAVEYARSIEGLFSPDAVLESKEIGDGNLNLIFRIWDSLQPKNSVIFKQALPYARVVGESWPLTLDRARIEREALTLHDQLAPGSVPKIYGYQDHLALTVMEDLSDYIILRKGLIARKQYRNFPKHIGSFLGKTLFFTSDYYLSSGEKKQKAVQFTNPELCKITEDLVFTDPFFDAPTNHFNPLLKEKVAQLWRNRALKTEVQKLKDTFMTRAQALIHGDLHTGSIMVTDTETRVIDPEFAFYGPMGFDIGAVFANLLLNYAAQEGHTPCLEERKAYQNYLLGLIKQIWDEFQNEFIRLWKEHRKETFYHPYARYYLLEVLQDAIGFAGCKMIRRVIGLAHVEDLESIPDPEVRFHSEKLALAIGTRLVLHRKEINDVLEATLLVRRVRTEEVKSNEVN